MATNFEILTNGVSSSQAKRAAALAIMADGVSDNRAKVLAQGYLQSGAGSEPASTPAVNTPPPPRIPTPAVPAGPSAAQTDPLLASLSSLDQILANRNAQSQAEYDRAITGYNEQDALDRQAYDQNVQQNEQTLTANNQRALLNAANSGSGLRGVLSSLGGLAGSGVDVVKRLVGLAANQDTGAARETFDTNATNLTQAWSGAEKQQRQRRQDADATLFNNKQNNESSVLSSRQSIFQQLANLYGDTAPQGREYASKASALAAPIAATSRAAVAPYAAASSSFSPAALQQYLAGTQNLEASAAGSASTVPQNSPLFTSQKKKDQLAGVA